MATTIKESFKGYKENLNITNRQEGVVSTCRNNVVTELSKEIELHSESKSLLIGSWDRDTLIRYLKEGDVDVIVVLNYGSNKDWDSAEGTQNVLNKFKKVLQEAYKTTPCSIDRNCVTMELSQFRLDVVPAFKLTNGGYHIPDCVQKKWIKTDPIEFAKKITEVNKNMDGAFVPLIKMVKGWNRNAGYPIKSFHLECILYKHYKGYLISYTYDSMLKIFFSNLPTYLSESCYDPVTLERVDRYLDNSAIETDREKAIKKAKKAAALSKEAYEDQENYPSVAIEEWKNLLGEFFPAYGS